MKEHKKMNQMMEAIKVTLIILVLFSSCKAQNKFEVYDKVKIYDHRDYYESNNIEIELIDSIRIGYQGGKDNVEVKINDKTLYKGVPDYNAKYGKAKEIIIFKRSDKATLKMEVLFGNKERKIIETIHNNVNSILIQNNQNYSKQNEMFPEDISIFLYKETDRFY